MGADINRYRPPQGGKEEKEVIRLQLLNNINTRTKREGDTVALMIEMYCRRNHKQTGLCEKCNELLQYALQCLERCPFGEGKTTCAKCPVHCYQPQMRQQIRAVMRYSGPRMVLRHPLITIRHLLDGRRKKPVKLAK